MPKAKKSDDAATAKRFEAALRRALNTPPDLARSKVAKIKATKKAAKKRS